jgi:restriction system protein
MQTNPDQCPTWDEFLRPLLELSAKAPIMRRTGVQAIEDQFHFSDNIRKYKLKSGQSQVQNRAGWAMSALVKAEFIEKHPTEKFTYQITDKGRTYLQQHQGPITDEDLKNLEGYIEAWQEASRKRQAPKESTSTLVKLETSTREKKGRKKGSRRKKGRRKKGSNAKYKDLRRKKGSNEEKKGVKRKI